MALFGKKTVTCALCGKEVKSGFLRGMFQRDIGGHYVCDACYGEVDLPTSFTMSMTLDQFKGYKVFREENQKLKPSFQITEEVDFGILEEKFYFDTVHNRMCMDKNLEKTIFKGKEICGFTIKEDENVIFRGDRSGLFQNNSSVRQQVMFMQRAVRTYRDEMRRYEMAGDAEKERMRKPVPSFDTKPFYEFRVEIYLDHPYWTTITANLGAPSLDSDSPDVMEYLRDYDRQYGIMQQLANALMTIAFTESPKEETPAAPAAPSADTVEELKRYKELLDMGIITNEEFTAKKRQLMGI